MTGSVEDLRRWARDVGAAYPDVALILLFEQRAAEEACVALVMRDGDTAPWFAEGKGIDGVAYTTVPGRDLRVANDARLDRPGLRLYLNFCDARALMFAYHEGRERMAGDELVGCPYRILHPEPDRVPPLPEFFYLWGDGRTAPAGEGMA